MLARITGGSTVAALSLAVTIPLAQAGSTGLAIIFGALSVLILLGTVAPWVPGLHRLPVVGAPTLTVVFSIGDDTSLEVSARADTQTTTAILRAGIRNDRRSAIADASINMLVPDTVVLVRGDVEGAATGAGQLLSTSESLGDGKGSARSHYWAEKGLTFSGRNSELLHFKLGLPGPGDFPLRLKISAEPLYEEHVANGVIRVVAQASPSATKSEAAPTSTPANAEPPRSRETRRTRTPPAPRPVPQRSESLKNEIRSEMAFGEQLRKGLSDQGSGAFGISMSDIRAWEDRVAYMFERHGKESMRDDFLAARPPSTQAPAAAASHNMLQMILRVLGSSAGPVERVDAKLARLSKIARNL